MISKLFQPISIGPVSLSNRVVMTAMHLKYTPAGEVTDRFIELYKARARGGAAFIIIGGAEIKTPGRSAVWARPWRTRLRSHAICETRSIRGGVRTEIGLYEVRP